MTASSIINISGYRFTHLKDPMALQAQLLSSLTEIGVKGAVVLAHEGANITLAGSPAQIEQAVTSLDEASELKGIWFKRSRSERVPHRRLRVRIRHEIISFDGAESEQRNALRPSAPVISPRQLDQWLDAEKPMVLLDARNDYEIVSGTFDGAVNLNIKHFKHFKRAVSELIDDGKLETGLPVVTFCTGGIRCEKAAPWLMETGFDEVYQVEGGVIHYLQQSNRNHWQGDLFVFDDRVEIDRALKPTGAGLCENCQLAVPVGVQCRCQLGPHYHAVPKPDAD